MVVVLLAVGRREAHVFGMYLLLLLAAPPAQTAIPGFGVVDHLFILDHYRLLALALLLPCALRLAQRNSTPRYFRAPMDIMVLGYLLLNTALAFRGDNFTNDVRTALMLWIDFFLPYYVASRSIQDKEGLRHALVGLAIGAVLLSTLAIVEVLRSWKLYDAANSALGLNTFGAYKTRGSFIRPSVTAIDSIVLGYVIVVAAGGYLYLQGLITGRFIRWCGWLALAAGVLGSLSRGPWVGMALLVARTARWPGAERFVAGYVQLFQGTPLLMQLLLAYFGLALFGVDTSAWVAAAVALTLYTSAFLVEIWRGCVAAVPKGQWEAAQSLALSFGEQLRYVILPQATRIAIAPTVGFLVQVVKGTALASVIGFVELTKAGTMITNATFQPFLVYSCVALLYFALCFPVSLTARHLERKMNVNR